jgi:hypothetical protein
MLQEIQRYGNVLTPQQIDASSSLVVSDLPVTQLIDGNRPPGWTELRARRVLVKEQAIGALGGYPLAADRLHFDDYV